MHIQHAHADHLKALDLSAHYTTTLQHFILFNKHFSLANEADLGLFDSIYELLNAPAVVPVIADFSSPSELPLGSFDSEVGESPELQNTASPTQTVSMKPDEIREDAKSDSIVVDKYVPVFTIVTWFLEKKNLCVFPTIFVAIRCLYSMWFIRLLNCIERSAELNVALPNYSLVRRRTCTYELLVWICLLVTALDIT